MPTSRRRIRIRLRGIVQESGSGRSFHNLALELDLAGYVLNSSAGLVAEVEAIRQPWTLSSRPSKTTRRRSPGYRKWRWWNCPAAGDATFAIRASVAETGEFALVSPDVATCDDCFRDFTDAANRRFGYAFTNCTNCGPRYSIICDIPYDRPNTTMAPFHMCAACQAEYDDPRDRRFHAQPNACGECGPALSAGIEEARRRLAAGEVLAIKGLGGFHLACDARNDAALRRLREGKRRSDKPFALMARDLAAVEAICEVSDADRRALLSPRRPIVVLPGKTPDLPREIAPGNRTLGVMLPYTPLHHLLFVDAPYSLLVMTSGNLSEEPIVVSNADARGRLAGVADWFLTHDRDIYMRTDDSVVRTFEGAERVMRRSRGFAPQTLDPGTPRSRVAGLRRRVEERLLPHQGPARHPEPAHRRPRKTTKPWSSLRKRSPI